jgi:hypothetical protein
MMMFSTEIQCTNRDGKRLFFNGPIVKADCLANAEKEAKKMNNELYVVGEYLGFLGGDSDLELS